MVTSETVVVDHPQQENVLTENRSIGKHKRKDDTVLTCFEPSAWPYIETRKRRALAPITNRQDWFPAMSSKVIGNAIQKKPVVKTTTAAVCASTTTTSMVNQFAQDSEYKILIVSLLL